MIETASSKNTDTPFQVTVVGKIWFKEDVVTLLMKGF